MKTRGGFVSNSSSSSFIIAYKVGDKCSYCGRSDIDISDVIRMKEGYDSDTDIEAEGISEIQDKMREDHEEELSYCHNRESRNRQLAKFIKHCAKLSEFADDYKLVWIVASYSDSEMIYALINAIKGEKIIDWY